MLSKGDDRSDEVGTVATARCEAADAVASDLEDFAQQIADQVESFLLALRAISAARPTVDRGVALLLLEVSQVLLAGGRLGVHSDFQPADEYEPDAGPDPDLDAMRLRLAVLLESVDAYSEVFDPYVDPPELVSSLLSDDLTSIATSLAHGLAHYGPAGSARRCGGGSSPTSPRGATDASAVLRALQSVVAHDRRHGVRGRAGPGRRGRDCSVLISSRWLVEGWTGDLPVRPRRDRWPRRRPAVVGPDADPVEPPTAEECRGHCRAEVRWFVGRRRRRASSGSPSGSWRPAGRPRRGRGGSAMGDTTDELLDLAQQVSPLPPPRELDMLLTAGERISMALLAMAIANLGQTARSFTGSQAGVITDRPTARRRSSTSPRPDPEGDRGGPRSRSWPASRASPRTPRTSRRWAGAARTPRRSRWPRPWGPTCCEIYTDVDGVFTADPRIVPTARKLDRVSYEEMLEMAACGAKVLHLRCVEYARRYGMPIHVRSSFSQKQGTWIVPEPQKEQDSWSSRSSPASRTTAARPRSPSSAVPDKVGEAAAIFETLADGRRSTST